MLTGQGIWTNNQLGYPVQVYDQINQAAVKAWKALPKQGEVSGNFTKFIQGNNEPFSEFVARMMEAAGCIFGDAEAAMPLIEQLVYEQCTKECRNAITPWKGKGLQAWMKACREIGGPLSNAGLAAAVLMAQTKEITCYNCGQTGHMQKQCTKGRKSRFEKKVPGICPICEKGRHWANECRSVRDIKGRPIHQFKVQQPKKRSKGPPSPGPPNVWGISDHRVHEATQRPRRATLGSAGLDICATSRVILTPQMGCQPISSDFRGSLPKDTVGLLLGKSSFALKGLMIHPGVIDSDYEGQAKIMCSAPRGIVAISPGDSIAQLLILPSLHNMFPSSQDS
jgi:dUTPase